MMKDVDRTKYNYKLVDSNFSYEEGVRYLQEHLTNAVTTAGLNAGDPSIITEICKQLADLSIPVTTYHIDKEDYYEYLVKAAYKKRYPDYYIDYLHEKTLEHYLSYKFLQLKHNDKFVDIASEHSPVPEIFERLTGCISYSQDIMFPSGVHGRQIGGDAGDIPVEKEFFMGAIATCSIEHFECDGDIRFMKEMGRVLKAGGTVVILPLYLYIKPATVTDPRYSIPGNVVFDSDSEIFCSNTWNNRHARFYSAQTLFDRLIKPNISTLHITVHLIDNPRDIHDSVYCRFVLVGRKQQQ